jgi:APA family basic amino acid/polyamine antiporter
MARNRELPTWLAAVHARNETPYRAEFTVGLTVAAITSLADLRGAIGFSSFAVLTYYAIANASAFTQPGEDRRWPRLLQVMGLAGCVLLALSLPASSVIGGGTVLAVGAVLWFLGNRTGAG